jgi:CHASE2 domain-containing sensor protein/nitrogen-specific signal transduction histidine kinase
MATRWLRREWRLLAIAPTATLAATLLGWTGALQRFDWLVLDSSFRFRPLEPPDRRITLVTISDQDIQRVGQWPIPDAVLAKALLNLKTQKPRIIGLDIYRDLPVEPGYSELKQVFRSTPNLIGVENQFGAQPVPPPSTLAQLGQVAFADLLEDEDGVVRRGLLAVRDSDRTLHLSFGTAVALRYLEDNGLHLKVINESLGQYQLGNVVVTPFKGNDGGYVWADDRGYQVLLNFRGSQDRFQTVPLTEVLEGRIPAQLVRDRIVLIGSTAESVNNSFTTPYDEMQSAQHMQTRSVVIHANITSQIISAVLDGRTGIRVVSNVAEALWNLSWAAIAAFTVWAVLQQDRWNWQWRYLGSAAIVVALEAGLLSLSYGLFLASWWVPVAAPLLSIMIAAVLAVTLHSHKLQDLALRLYHTTQTQAVELERLDHLKDEFLSTISHELRTPIANIRMATQMLEVNLVKLGDTSTRLPAVEQYVQILKDACQREASLINDLLDLADVTANPIPLCPVAIDLSTWLPDLIAPYAERIPQNQQTLTVKIADFLPPLTTDETYLKRILNELLTNACKYTPQGESIIVAAELIHQSPSNATKNPDEQATPTLQISVANTGVEIPLEERSRIFDKFYRIPDLDPWKHGGAGIGLALVQKLSDRLGATIQASSFNQQTLFTLTFPIDEHS